MFCIVMGSQKDRSAPKLLQLELATQQGTYFYNQNVLYKFVHVATGIYVPSQTPLQGQKQVTSDDKLHGNGPYNCTQQLIQVMYV